MNTRLTRVSLALAAIGALFVAGVAFADPLIPGKTRFGDLAPIAPVEETRAHLNAAPASDRVSLLVHIQAGADRGPLRGFAAAQGGYVKYEYDILPNVMNLRGIPQGALNALAATPGVVRWEPDGEVHAHMNDSTPLIRALQSQISGAGLSADGAGVRVCIIDTGIDSDHTMYDARIDTAAGRDFVNNDNNPEDDAGHGSHVAGTAVGRTGLTVNFGCVGSEPFQGVAPEATLIGIKVLNSNGSGSFSDVIAGINYGADQTPTGGRCDVINMSLGGGAFSGNCDSDSAAIAANNAVDAGVVVVASSGNDANANAMGTPACASKVIAVGATYDDDFPNCDFPSQNSFTFCIAAFIVCTATCTDNSPSVDQITCMSNRSTELDVTAPGCITFSADKDASPNGIVGFCGTSMASPHVAGLAALLLSADSTLTPAEVRQHIRDGAIELGAAGFDTVYGHGRIDAINSLNLVGTGCSVPADCDDGNDCNVDICNAGTCEHTLEPAGTVCRASAGTCDVEETCDGVTAACPADALVAAGTVCRASAGVCDPQETCDGVSAACPADTIDPAGTECRASTGSCDPTEVCSGVSVACPLDTLEPSGTLCRASTGPCDVEETCDGVTATCPADAFQAAGTSCSDSIFCNGAETCDGFGACEAGTDPCPGGTVCNEATDTCDIPVCNNDGTCDSGEDCNNCPNDCIGDTGGTPGCDNGTCEPGEDCNNCPQDCRQKVNGNPNSRYCCDGDLPDCGDTRCSDGGFACGPVTAGFCCGDGTCEGVEDGFNCSIDCGDPPACGDTFCDPGEDECSCASDCCAGAPATETGSCSDGCDNDCDGLTDTADPDCACAGNKEFCNINSDCCSGNCKNNSCKGN